MGEEERPAARPTGVSPPALPEPPRPGGPWSPAPLPVDDVRTRRDGRTTLFVLVGIFILAFACLAVVVSATLSPFFGLLPGALDAVGADTGTMRTQWAGDGRYAVAEYVSGGKESTTSVVAWDSVTGQTHRADGFRLVSVEPSSTRVWLSEAPRPTSTSANTTSPWEEPASQGPGSDGPGTAFVWDLASAAAPCRPASTTWQPWRGPAGITALMRIDSDEGLWPMEIRFASAGGDSTVTVLPTTGGGQTFLPVGWSPSGRYFAVWRPDSAGDGDPSLFIIEARTATVVSSDANASYSQLAGAAWAPDSDVLWLVGFDTDDESGDLSVKVASLEPGGRPIGLTTSPAAWRRAFNIPMVLGTDGQGVVVLLEGESGQQTWWLRDGRAVAGESFGDSATDVTVVESGSYSQRGGLIVASTGSADGWNLPTSAVGITDLSGGTPKVIWPK
jgi:hypothetical protein